MIPRAVMLLAATVWLGGCDLTSSGNGPVEGRGMAGAFAGAVFGGSNEQGAAAVTNAALGSMIGPKIGGALDDTDRRLAYDAQIDALEHGSPGAPVPWRNPKSGRYGNIVPGPLYDQRGAKCRGYSHTVSINGNLEIARGTACRRSDGAWTAIS